MSIDRIRYYGVLFALLIAVSASGCTTLSSVKNSGKSTGERPIAAAATAAPGVQVVHLEANDALEFVPSSTTVKPGRVQVVLAVTGNLPQTFTSTALHADSGAVMGGQSTTLEIVVPKPGKYRFYSTYHKKQGMKGMIVAQP